MSSRKTVIVDGSYKHELSIPTSWEFAELKDVIEIVGGSQPPKSEFLSEPAEGSVRLIQIRDYKSDKNIVYIPKEKAKRFVTKDEVMIGRYGPPIFQILRGLEGAYNVALMKAKPKGGVFSNDYLYWYLSNQNLYHYVESASDRTAGQSGVNKKHLELYPVGIPPLAEQTRIVEKLDEVLAQVDTIKARLDGIPAIIKRFRQSVLAAAVSGGLTKCGEYSEAKFSDLIVEMKNGLSPKPNDDGIGLPILRISAVRPKELDFSDHKYLECDDKRLSVYALKNRDLLFTRYNGSLDFVGVCALVNNLDNKTYLYPDKLIRVRTNFAKLQPEYAEIFFSSPKTRRVVTDFVKSTSGQKGISGKDLKSVIVEYPAVEEQNEIVRLVEQYFALADTIEAQVKKAQQRVDNLTQSILAKAFRGELVPQDSSDEPADKLLERIAEARIEAEALAKVAKKAEAARKKTAKAKQA